MKKSKRRSAAVPSISEADENVIESHNEQQNRFWSGWSTGERIGVVAVCLFLSLAAFGAGLKYLEESARQQKFNAKNSSNKENASLLNSINPFVEPPLPTATPQLSKEYIYAGSRMLAVEDKNASALPPADLAVWRPSSGYWYVLGGQSVQWGATFNTVADIPVPGDYDGDGKTDFSVFRPGNGTWYVSNSSNGYTIELQYGQSSDIQAQADYDGDGKTDMAIYRPSTGSWYITRSSTQSSYNEPFGLSTDIPAPADYDGDGRADIAVWRASASTFYVKRSSDNSLQSQMLSGASGDKQVSADYDGDGKADFAVRVGNNWLIRYSGTSYNTTTEATTVAWQAGEEEVQNDYDGDGKVDVAVWRAAESFPGAGDSGYWLIRQSSQLNVNNGLRAVQWGASTDVPVPAFYRR
jgi:hypothetical protein